VHYFTVVYYFQLLLGEQKNFPKPRNLYTMTNDTIIWIQFGKTGNFQAQICPKELAILEIKFFIIWYTVFPGCRRTQSLFTPLIIMPYFGAKKHQINANTVVNKAKK
jgi:hypothetical protein